METYKVTYKWTKEEVLKSVRHHYQSKLRPIIVAAINVVAVLLTALSIFILTQQGLRSSASPTACVISALAIYWFFLRRQVNDWWLSRGFDKTPAANELIQWEFSEEQVSQECAGLVSFKADWKVFSKIMEASDGFLLYTYPKNMFYWLPFAGFQAPEGIEKFKSIVHRKQIPYVKTTG